MKNAVLFVTLFLAASAVQAQTAGVVTLRANATSATGSMAPVLTWSTNPVANQCSASGGWSGTKAAAGTQTLATITASTNYTLTCTWATGTARVSWVAPTTNTDGSTLINLARFRVYYGNSASALSQSSVVDDITMRAATISSLSPGTWFFSVRAVNTSQQESGDSNIASKTVSGATASGTVGITINATPPPPPPPPPPNPATRRITATPAYDVIPGTDGRSTLGRVVGTVPVGKACQTYFLSGDYYGVNTALVTLTRSPRGSTVVAHCAIP